MILTTNEIVYVLLREDKYYIYEAIVDRVTDDGRCWIKYRDHVSIYNMLINDDDIGDIVFIIRDELFKKVYGEYIEYSKNGCPVVNINGELMELGF